MPRDQVRATPRNSALGALADFLAQSYSPERTQQMQGVAKFLDMPAISETIDRLSYDPSGRSLFTGAGGLGGTTRFRPEVLDAAMAVAPGAGALGKLAAQGTMAAGRAGARLAERAVPRIMERGGMGAEMLQGMSRGTVSPMDVYRVLNEGVKGPQSEALRLAQQRAALPPSKGGLGLPTNNTPQQRARAMDFEERGFHETEGANIENGLTNFDVRRAGAAASDEQTPYAMFIKPHPAGLGIAKNNPAQMPLMVKSNLADENIMRSFANRDELQQYLNQFPHIKQSTKAVRDLDNQMADYMDELSKKMDKLYAEGKTIEADSIDNSMTSGSPLMKAFDARMHELAATSKEQITDLFKSQGVGTVGLRDDAGALGRNTITEMVLDPNDNVRSRFAAFDPFRRTAAVAAAMGVAAPNLMAKEIEDPTNQPPEYQSGGVVKLLQGMLVNSGEKAITAAQRAAAGRAAAELIKSQEQVKASEALGQLMEKGFKQTTTTQADRTRVGGGNIGGAPFPALSQADPAYAGKVWGVMDEGAASRLKNLTTPDTAWTTMLGSAIQLKTNPVVFDKLKRGFIDSMKQGNLSDELAGKINHNLSLTFGKGVDIRDPGIWKLADTFDKRAALADAMMGQGIAPGLGGVALGGEKSGRGVIFRPTDILKRETEPSLLHTQHGGDVPTYAAGPRLFSLEPESMYRPDLHPGFPTLIKGEDLNYNMMPTPTEVYLPDWHARFKTNNPERKAPGYYDLALGVEGEGLPSQALNNEYIRHLLREGFAGGGSVGYAGGGAMSKGLENLAKKVLQKSSSEVLPMAEKKIIQAPSIIIPSKVSNVKEAVRQSKGDYGARRVERAADEIPNLERLYKEEALKQAFAGDNARAMMTMNPKDFENYSIPLGFSKEYRDEMIRLGLWNTDNDINYNHIQNLRKMRGGFADVPFLEVNKERQGVPTTPAISGHEGRHRNRAMADSGEQSGLVRLEPRAELREPFPRRSQEEYIDALRQELGITGNMVKPEPIYEGRTRIERPAIELPDIYAKGGAVHFDEGGAAFGVFPQMKARRVQQDREAAANAPLSALRGWAAGTAGLAGDIEGLARAGISQLPPQLLTAFPALRAFGIGSRADPTPQLPTTEFYNEYLPGAQLNSTPTGKAFTTAGNLFGGTGSTTLARYGIKSTAELADLAARIAAESPRSGSRAAQLGVIKMPGGNFLTGRTEKDLQPLKTPTFVGETPAQRISKHEELLKNPTLSQDQRDRVQRMLDATKGEAAIDKWVDSNLTNYVKKQMGTPDDPVRKLAERGITHKPALLNEYLDEPLSGSQMRRAENIKKQRMEAGFPEEGLGQSPMAKAWELASDESIAAHRAGDIQGMPERFAKFTEAENKMRLAREELDKKFKQHIAVAGLNERQEANLIRGTGFAEKAKMVGDTDFAKANTEYLNAHVPMMDNYMDLGRQNPYINKLDPETPMYAPFTGDLGFDHIMDVLREDVTAGRIRPEQLNKVSMEQAVRRTYEYDQELAAKANASRAAAREGLPTYREYPEGYKWIQLNKPGAFAQESEAMGHSVRGYEPPKGHPDWTEASGDAGSSGYGHGGWEAIKSGDAKVYSLVDPKGESHVTIEVGRPYRNRGFNVFEQPTGDEYYSQMNKFVAGQNDGTVSPKLTFAEWWRASQGIAEPPPMPYEITQVKGKGNAAPQKGYLPYVQDFVKSGDMPVKRDLQNTGLRDLRRTPKLDEYLKQKGVEVPRYLDEGEYQKYESDFLMDQLYPKNDPQYLPPQTPEGMAQGGLVSNHFDPIKIKQIIAGLDDDYDPENIQQIIAQRESAYA